VKGMASSSSQPEHQPKTTTKSEQFKRWAAVREKNGNNRCAECESRDTSWAVLDYGILICVNCAGSHRALGTHISKVRSTALDTFTEDEFEWVESLGNEKSNGLWEAGLPPSMRRPAADAPACIRRIWLRQKYDEQRFTAGNDTTAAPEHESHRGWIWKQGGFVPTWRKRYFCVEKGRLLYFNTDALDDGSFRGSMPLLGTSLHLDDEDGRTLTLRTTAEDGGTVSLLLRALDTESAEEWLWALYQSAAAAQRMSSSAAEPPQRRKASLFGGFKREARRFSNKREVQITKEPS